MSIAAKERERQRDKIDEERDIYCNGGGEVDMSAALLREYQDKREDDNEKKRRGICRRNSEQLQGVKSRLGQA